MQSETVTMLNDMCLLAPSSLIHAPVTWSEATERRVQATFNHEGRTVSARLSFNDDGSLANFESDDRYRIFTYLRFEVTGIAFNVAVPFRNR